MKTIVARFTEMKKAPGEIIEVDGEEVNVNKVEAALKSVGVQLRDTQGQFRDLDDVFLELASKWDSLDVMSQRYVATMAAGSRQQSRFIAMMSNYQRTMELTGYATNSAGASQKQFEKTMDSLESKLNRLHDAWEQYVTGIANQSIIKGVVDLLTSLLETVNKVTDALDPFHTGWSKILAAFLGFKAAKGVVNGVLKGIGTQLGTRKPNQTTVPGGGPTKTGLDEKQGTVDGTKYGKGFWGAFQKMQAQKRDPSIRPIASRDADIKRRMQQQGLSTTKYSLLGKDDKAVKKLTSDSKNLKERSKLLGNQKKQLEETSKSYTKYAEVMNKGSKEKNFRAELLKTNGTLLKREEAYQKTLDAGSKEYTASQKRIQSLKEEKIIIENNKEAKSLENEVKKRGTVATNADTVASELNTEASEKEALANELDAQAKEKDALATDMNTKITSKDTIQQEANNMTRLQAIAGLFSLNSTKRLAAAVSLGLMSAEEAEAIATGGATAAQTAFNAALYSCPIMWIIAGIALLTAGLIALIAILVSSDDKETKLEKLKREQEDLNKALEDATTKANEAQEAYSDLLAGKNTYDALYDEISKLTAGTELFKQKAEEAKKTTEELLTNFPELEDYTTYIKGIKVLTKAGYQQAIKLQNDAANTAEAIKQGVIYFQKLNNIEIIKEQRRVDTQDSYDDFTMQPIFPGRTTNDDKTPSWARNTENNNPLVTGPQFPQQKVNDHDMSAILDYYDKAYDVVMKYPDAFREAIESDKIFEVSPLAAQYYGKNEKGKSIQYIADPTKSENGQHAITALDLLNYDLQQKFPNNKYLKSLVGQAVVDAMSDLNDITQFKQQARGAFGQILAKSLSSKGYSDDFINDYINYFTTNNDLIDSPKVYNEKVEEYTTGDYSDNTKESLEALAKKYKDITGIEYEIEDSIYESEDEIERVKNALTKELAAYDVFQSAVNNYSANISENVQKYGSKYHDYLKVITGNTENMSDELIKALIDGTDAFSYFGTSDLANSTAWKNAQQTVINNLEQLAIFFDTTYDEVKKIGEKKYKLINNFGVLFSNWQEQTGIVSDFSDVDLNDLDEVTYNKLNEIDWSNPIQSLQTINSLAEEGNKNLNNLANDIKQNFEALLNTKKQVQQIFSSIDTKTWDTISEDFQVTADEIVDLEDELPIIKTMMDETGISAYTLSEYFTKVARGELSVISTSNNFVSALEKAKAAMNNINKSIDFAENFSTSPSSASIDDNFSEFRENIEQFLTRGQYGDPALVDYTKMILGNDNFDKYYSQFNGNLQKIEELAYEKINSFGENFYGFWTQFSDLSSFSSINSDGSINFDFSQFDSIEELSKELQDKMKVSEDFANAAIASAQTYSTNLTTALNKLSFSDSINELIQGAFSTTQDGKTKFYLSESELQILADEAGLSEEELDKVKEKIQTELSKQNYEIEFSAQPVLSDLGGLSEDIRKQIATNLKAELDSGQGANLGGLFRQLLEEGFSEDEAKNQINSILSVMSKELGNTTLDVGQVLTLDDSGKLQKMSESAARKAGYPFYESIEAAISGGLADGVKSDVAAAAEAYERAVQEKATFESTALGISAGYSFAMDQEIDFTSLREKIAKASEEGFSDGITEAANNLKNVKIAASAEGQVNSINFDFDFGNTTSYNNTDAQNAGKKGGSWPSNDKTGSDSDNWTNDYDQYYNTLKKIEGLERKRTELEKQQSRLTKQRYLDEEKIQANKKAQVDLLRQQARINSDLANTAAAYLRGDSNGDVWFDEATGTIQTNPNAAYYNEEQMKAFNDQKSLMEDHYETWKEAKDNLEDIYDAIDELTEVAEFSLEDLTDSVDRAIDVLDNTLTNLDREISRLDRYNSGATSSDYKKRYEQSAQTYADKYNQLTQKKAINEQKFNGQIYSEYGKYIDVDWDTKEVTKSAEYYAIVDPDVKDSVDDFVSEAQEIASKIIDMDNQQEEIKDSLYELQQTLADKSLEFQEKVYDAVVKAREDEITTLNTINDSIKDAASELISSIQKNIQKIRQERSNKKTEEELSKMQSRLDFLRMDTSSGNQKAILDLEKQLEDKEESYTDALIDQKISELQDQNTEAEKQRKRQIEIMETQLELSKENGAIWKAVDDAIKTGFNSSGRIQKGSDLYNMLSSLDEVTKKNSVQFERWFGELNNLAAAYNANLTADLDTSGQMSNTVSNANDVYGENSEYIKSLKSRLEAMNRDGNFNHLMWYDQEGQKMVYKYSHYYASSQTEADAYNKKVAEYQALARKLANARAFYKTNKNASFTSAFNRLYGYDTGGLADYTGLAWLDGTPTSPEMVLSSKDTENFIQLKDILSNVMNGETGKNNNTNGDYYFEIAINVDKVTSDYDVDQIADRIKQQISDSARYRNVNVINLLR